MSAKLLLILGIVLGIIALALLAPLEPKKQLDAVMVSGELVESGHFALLRGDAKWLDESFSLFLTPSGDYLLVSHSTLSVSGAAIRIADQTQYDAEYRPVAYQLAAETASGTQVVSAQRGERAFTMEVRAGIARQASDIPLDPDLLLLDNNVLAHYAVLYEAIRAGAVGQTFSAAVPQILAQVPARWEEPIAVRFQSGSEMHEGKEIVVHLGDTAIYLVSYEGRLVGLVNRSQGTVAYDVDLLPDGFSLPEPGAQSSSVGLVERAISFRSGDLTLAGTLTLPSVQTAPRCAVLFVAGSGPVDRDGNAASFHMDAYRQLAQTLAGEGIASLRYDKRGVGESQGSDSTASRSDLLADVRAAWGALRALPELAGVPRVALGHSEGTYLVEDLAAGNPDVAGLVLLCGSPQSLAGVTRWQVETLLRQQGASDDQVRAALEQEDQYLAFVKASSGQWADYSVGALQSALPWLTDAAAQQLKSSTLGLA
ncbi:MAG: alpha/beta hydrolase, partial [Candidatus Bipolaricaulota bacterium]|nr:alpha/beta hydrolase [Candidatus Bipolaricaulota bacterium]